MTKSKKLDDFDANEWGNIELPGMPDDKLFGINWNKSRKGDKDFYKALDKRNSDPEYHKKRNSALKETYQDANWRSNVAKANQAKPLDPKYKAAHQASYTPEVNLRRSISVRETYKNDPTLGIKSSERGKKMWSDPNHKVKIQQCVLTPIGAFESYAKAADAYGIGRGSFSNKFKREQAKDSQAWRNISLEEFSKYKKTKIKPVSALPGAPKYVMTKFGAFRGLAEAARHAEQQGIANARNWISKQLDLNPRQFYFISKEQYLKLKK